MTVEYAGQKVDLLPCPFCGGEPAIYGQNWAMGHNIFCTGVNCPTNPVTHSRLAAYEDTGLGLEEVESLKAGICLGCSVPEVSGEFRHIQNLLQAEKDGRLVVLPCKKGDTLWSYYDYPTWGISKIAVTAVSTLDGITVINTDNYGVIEEKDIGETVFLTREEAETALKKREEGTL